MKRQGRRLIFGECMKNYNADSTTFKNSFARLKKIVGELEKGGSGSERSLRKYREARELLSFCAKKLNEAQKKAEGLLNGKITR